METRKENRERETLENKLDNFLNDTNTQKECEGDECIINDGKEIVERVNKVYKTNDGRQLLM